MVRVSIDNTKQCLVNVKLGKGIKIFNFVNAYGCSIDNGTKIGAFVEIQKGSMIGKNCKISSHSFICEGVHIADNVFIGHNVTFTNDKFPRATTDEGQMQTDNNWECIKTFVEEGASIGSGATILCGVRIGKKSIIGAGSVVVHNVADNSIVAGNPARFIRLI
ncbi:MAG: acetyltransferase [Mucilaginibacter sp.]|nr:acetyltransferase [Mucilaginibacter sp.]